MKVILHLINLECGHNITTHTNFPYRKGDIIHFHSDTYDDGLRRYIVTEAVTTFDHLEGTATADATGMIVYAETAEYTEYWEKENAKQD